ncbi:MAG: MFS transporter, partial [Pseudomonadota bacterium]
LVFAPFRALIGHRSDTHKSAIGWRRVPYIWMGLLLQFGGLAIMPFALLVLTDRTMGPEFVGPMAVALAFLMVGAGMHTTQTAGLALATDLAPQESRPRVVALLYVMLLVGMVGAAIVYGFLLTDFSAKRLIQVIQGSAVAAAVFNLVALWKQEARRPEHTRPDRESLSFRDAWAAFRNDPRSTRVLVAAGLGTMAFSMQDVLLEPYGGEVLGLSVSATTALTALFAGGTLLGFALAARMLSRGADTHRLAANGALVGIAAFSLVVFAAPFDSPLMFRIGTALIGFGAGLFAVGTMTAAMDLAEVSDNGLALGAWSAVQATAAGVGLALGGAIRDIMGGLADAGHLGVAMAVPATGYTFVYHIEIGLLFVSLIAIGPLVRYRRVGGETGTPRFGLAELPG